MSQLLNSKHGSYKSPGALLKHWNLFSDEAVMIVQSGKLLSGHVYPIAQPHTFTVSLSAVFLNTMLSLPSVHSCCCFVHPSPSLPSLHRFTSFFISLAYICLRGVIKHHQCLDYKGEEVSPYNPP